MLLPHVATAGAVGKLGVTFMPVDVVTAAFGRKREHCAPFIVHALCGKAACTDISFLAYVLQLLEGRHDPRWRSASMPCRGFVE